MHQHVLAAMPILLLIYVQASAQTPSPTATTLATDPTKGAITNHGDDAGGVQLETKWSRAVMKRGTLEASLLAPVAEKGRTLVNPEY